MPHEYGPHPMPMLRISALLVSSLFLFNATDAHADPPAQVSPAPGDQPAPPPPGTPPVVTPQANADGPVPGTTITADNQAVDNSSRPPLGLAIGLGAAGIVCPRDSRPFV
jgi:hypothetical protein